MERVLFSNVRVIDGVQDSAFAADVLI